MMEAIWGTDYDYRTDAIYERPVCPECKEPIGVDEDGKYHCYSCGEVVEVKDQSMIEWLEKRNETKVEYADCHIFTSKNGATTGCGGKGTVETHYMRNPVTLKWQIMGGRCKKCGMRYIV